MIPDWIGAYLLRASAIGARQFVVHEAAEIIVSSAFSVLWLVF
jgi:hypothetical protein